MPTAELSTPRIVCAACRHKDYIAAGPRHFDNTMFMQVEAYRRAEVLTSAVYSEFEQGFVDQHGQFYNREEAMVIVEQSGQPFDAERNAVPGTLYSEGLY